MNELNENNGNSNGESTPPPEPAYTGKTYAYIGIALAVLSALAVGLTFTVLGIYSLISSILLSLASLSFINVQKRKNNFRYLFVIKICAYAVLGVSVVLFIGGLIWSAI